MNSPPSVGISVTVKASRPARTRSVTIRCRSTQTRARTYPPFIIRSTSVSFSSVLFLKRNEQSTGASVTAIVRAPQIAKAYVLAIGPKRAPSGPVMAKSGRKAQTMIIVEKKSARSISCEASAIRSISGRLRSTPWAVMWR